MPTKGILKLLFRMDFFKNKKLMTKHLYLLYTLMAGMYYESYVYQWFGYFTKIYFIISLIDSVMNCLITLSQWKVIDTSVIMLCVSLIVITQCVCLILVISYYWREDIHKSFKIIDEYCKSYEDYTSEVVVEEEQSYIAIDYNKYLKFHYIFPLSLFYIFCFYTKLIKVCLTVEESSDINNNYDYTYPVQYLTHVNLLEYVLMYFVQTTFIIPFCASVCSTIMLQILFSIIIRNQLVSLINEIKFESNLITTHLDCFYKQEIELLEAKTTIKNKNLKLSDISKERKLCYERFTNHIKKWIFRYQKLFTVMFLQKDYVGAISSFVLLGLTILCLGFGYISMMTMGEKHIEYFFYIILYFFSIFGNCFTGHLYNSMMEELEKEIYSMPWYYFPPTQRKLILNFLSIVQRPCTLKAFKVYPISLNLFPRILMKVFSYLQIIRVMEAKVKT